MNDSARFNVMVDEARVHGPLHGCPISYQVVDRFSRFDLNVEIHPDRVNDFTDWCEENGVKCEML